MPAVGVIAYRILMDSHKYAVLHISLGVGSALLHLIEMGFAEPQV